MKKYLAGGVVYANKQGTKLKQATNHPIMNRKHVRR